MMACAAEATACKPEEQKLVQGMLQLWMDTRVDYDETRDRASSNRLLNVGKSEAAGARSRSHALYRIVRVTRGSALQEVEGKLQHCEY